VLVVILGTRPEIIKTAPVVLEAMRRGIPVAIVHTGQHYDDALDGIFFRELGLPQPAINLRVGSMPVLKQLGAMIDRLHDAFETLKPKVVMVQGDTNSVLAGALAAHKSGITVAHLEAGLRSDDWDMPEEANRVLAGIVADIHFCPTEVQRGRLLGETILEGVYVVGNTVVDAALHYHEIAKSGDTLSRFGINSPYALLTMHRPSNVDESDRLQAMIEMLSLFAETRGWKIVFPVHPPCVTLRANTERPETVDAGGNVLYASTDPAELGLIVDALLAKSRDWICPFGDGMTAKRVIDILHSSL